MPDFEIDVQRANSAHPESPASIAIRSGGTVFTRLLRPGADGPEDYVFAPPAQLAFWLVDNWWRLRSECVPAGGPTADWRLAHDLSGMGGYAWPRLAVWGEGDRIGISSRSDPAGVVGPVRYLTDALIYVRAAAFETEVDAFLSAISAEQSGASDAAALRSQIEALAAERADPEISAWRRLEAQLGFDVDEAPEQLMQSLSDFSLEFGAAAVGEAAQATQGLQAAQVLATEIASAREHNWQCDLRRTANLVGKVVGRPGDPPWRLGERAAAAVREALSIDSGPLTNEALADILQTPQLALDTADNPSRRPAYALRLDTGTDRGEIVALSSRWSAGRRFEFARALGDAVQSEGEHLGLITRAKTERQKFQRAFAQSLLCPHEDLMAFLGDDTSDDALSAAAKHFQVSERLVQSVLVNKRVLERGILESLAAFRPITEDGPAVGFDEAVEAA